MYAHEQKIGCSGLWNTQQLEAETLKAEQVDYLRRLD
jgi:hypothetical protein